MEAEDAFETARKMATLEGIPVGISSARQCGLRCWLLPDRKTRENAWLSSFPALPSAT